MFITPFIKVLPSSPVYSYSTPELLAQKYAQSPQPGPQTAAKKTKPLPEHQNNTEINKTETKPADWMRDVKPFRTRTRKQSYVRSGSHGFCVRLYTGQGDDAES